MPDQPTPVRLLLIDDEDVTRMVVRELLSDLGYEVLEADTGQAGLEILRKEPVEAVITDFGLPDMTGAEVAAAVRTAHPDLLLVLLTGWDPSNAALGAEDFDGVLKKPCQYEDLEETMTRVLTRGSRAA